MDEYWALHQWLFDAYCAGLRAGGLASMPKEVAMTMMIGPDWREEEEKIALDFARERPEEALFLRQLVMGETLRWVEVDGKVQDIEIRCPGCGKWNLKTGPGAPAPVSCSCRRVLMCPDVVYGPPGQPTTLDLSI